MGMTDFHGVFAVIDEETGDGRLLAPDSVTLPNPPLPLLATEALSGGHQASRIVGRIDRVWIEDNEVRGEGIIDPGPLAELEDPVAQIIIDILAKLEEEEIIYGGADFDDVLIDGDSGVMLITRARFRGFHLYMGDDPQQSAFGDRTWIKEGAWPV
jgi:hypothetical protein